jgi:hypothetical protein
MGGAGLLNLETNISQADLQTETFFFFFEFAIFPVLGL